jgi:two-component system cell cycle sensor histidine kinase/response regulator CckA
MKRHPDYREEIEKEAKDRTVRLDKLNTELTEEIGELKKAEEALVKREQMWGQIFNALSDLIMILDDQHRILHVNKAMAGALGMTEEEAIGQICFELVHGTKECPDSCPHKCLLADGKEHSAEVFEPRLGGTYDVRVFPLLGLDGARLGSVHVARDMNRRKQALERIQQQSQFLRNVLDSLTHHLYVIDANDYSIVVANRAAELDGIAVGQKCYAATHGVTGPCSGPEHPCPVIEVKITRKPVTVEHIHFDPQGDAKHIEVHAHPIMTAEGEVLQVIEYALDITKRKRAEEALERRVIALTRPLDEAAGIAFEDLFNLDEIQKLQDQFAKAAGVASLITRPDGTPITQPSNFCRLCSEIVRETEKGQRKCHYSDSMMGRFNPDGPIVQACLSAGLCNAGSSITVGGRHIANWMIGQVRNESLDAGALGAYARTIGADEEAFMEAYQEVPLMSQEQFDSVAQALFTLAKQLSTLAYQNVQQARFITERKAAEAALRESEEKLRLFIGHAPTALAMFDREMRYLAASRSWIQDYRLGDRDIIDKLHFEIFPKMPDRWKEVLRRGLEGEVLRADEDCFEWTDGSVHWLRWEVQPWYAADGGVGGVVVFTENITERKQAEEARLRSERKYRNLFNESRDGVFFVLRDGEIKDVNPSFLELYGYTAKEMIGKNILDLYVDPADRPVFQDEIEEKGFVKDYETRLRKKDGTEVDCLLTASVQFGDDGSIVGYRGIVRDLTIRKRLQSQLFQAQKMEAIGTLAGGIAHDFNNMLQIILGSADLLVMQKGKESLDLRHLEAIRKAAKDGRDLVKGLLMFSRQSQTDVRTVDINKQLKHFRAILERTIPKSIEIELILTDGLNMVNADSIQIDQVLMNLSINAHQAMPEGGKLTIEARNATLDEDYCRIHVEAKPGEYVMLKISDTGHGMEKEVVERIFEPFFTTKGAGEGTGLGLSIVYGIVKNHDGCITCSSEPGQGTTFRIYLPAVTRESEPDMATMAGEDTASGTEVILLVDDELPIRNAVESILTPRGYKVLTAKNGSQALEIYQENGDEIDLVVLDLNMPGMGGTEVLEAILEINPRARVLVASGYSDSDSIQRFQEIGASEFIGKPFDAREILRAVRRVLDEKGSQRNRVSVSRPVFVPLPESEETSDTAAARPDELSRGQEAPDTEQLPWRLRILAIDDRQTYLRMLEAGLNQFGQTLLTASSGIEGLQIFRETPVDLVVCDLGMPEINGWEVARRIKEICQEKEVYKTPFILLTGETYVEGTDLEVKGKMADCGVDAIVGKPVDIPDLLEVIAGLMEKSRGSKD